MATAGHGGPAPDLYQLLGVPRDASAGHIALAWRRRARAEHPDARPADADAPGRFRALAEAYRVLGDPARRAAYDRALPRGRQPSRVRVTVRQAGTAGTGGMAPPARMPVPPLRAGPVRVEGPGQAPPAPGQEEVPEDQVEIRLAVLAELALRFMARDPGRPW
jgi:curved DNA-binding protein CbpA